MHRSAVQSKMNKTGENTEKQNKKKKYKRNMSVLNYTELTPYLSKNKLNEWLQFIQIMADTNP